MTGHGLDKPAWAALGSRHRAHAQEHGAARRYDPGIVPFAASLDNGEESLAALAELIRPGEVAAFLQREEQQLPAGFNVTLRAEGVQMVAGAAMAPFEDERVIPLGPVDAAEMLALATLTRPGPFTLRALELGRFWGIRQDGRLLAMAGQRMALPGHVELSGVCSHPDARGRGYARLLSRYVAGRIGAQGDVPYLHAYASNEAAIGLYRSIGFEVRTAVSLTLAERQA